MLYRLKYRDIWVAIRYAYRGAMYRDASMHRCIVTPLLIREPIVVDVTRALIREPILADVTRVLIREPILADVTTVLIR